MNSVGASRRRTKDETATKSLCLPRDRDRIEWAVELYRRHINVAASELIVYIENTCCRHVGCSGRFLVSFMSSFANLGCH